MPTSDYERIRQAIEFLRQNADRQPSLDELAQAAGLSAPWLQRLFRRWTGVSPKRFLQYLAADRAKTLLRDSVPVLDAAFESGLSGPGRLHDLIVSTDAVTPGEFASCGRGVTIRWGVHDTPFGFCLIGITGRGICALRFLDSSSDEGERNEVESLEAEWPHAELVRDDQGTREIMAKIFAGDRAGNGSLMLHLKGTNFQLKVWEALLRIPEGSAITYGGLAGRLGMNRSIRAVASAVGANPVGWLIPCHRVLRSSGALGGYRWGLERKALMLAREMVKAPTAIEEPVAG